LHRGRRPKAFNEGTREKVRAEWAMICTAHNLLKLFTLANAA